ncbi:MAG: ASCH domain-containing protein [Acidobacteriia bacterium]|nr:ASCH domain-containing protein [Terriglobia bacterium]
MRVGRALTIRQPWASMIVWGLKTVEVRSWSTEYRGEIFIHAAKRIDERAASLFCLDDLPRGALLGTVQLVDVEPLTPDRWKQLADDHLQTGACEPGLYAWHVASPKALGYPIQFQGELGLFQISIDEALVPCL